MRGITPITFEFVYTDKPESKQRLAYAYHRIFRQAWKNILDKQSTQKYTGTTYEKSTDAGRVSDNRGSSQGTQGDESHALSNGSEGENTSCEVREGVADKLPTSERIT